MWDRGKGLSPVRLILDFFFPCGVEANQLERGLNFVIVVALIDEMNCLLFYCNCGKKFIHRQEVKKKMRILINRGVQIMQRIKLKV